MAIVKVHNKVRNITLNFLRFLTLNSFRII